MFYLDRPRESETERLTHTHVSVSFKKMQQTSTADMLDLAVQHIKGLQNQIQVSMNALPYTTTTFITIINLLIKIIKLNFVFVESEPRPCKLHMFFQQARDVLDSYPLVWCTYKPE